MDMGLGRALAGGNEPARTEVVTVHHPPEAPWCPPEPSSLVPSPPSSTPLGVSSLELLACPRDVAGSSTHFLSKYLLSVYLVPPSALFTEPGCKHPVLLAWPAGAGLTRQGFILSLSFIF